MPTQADMIRAVEEARAYGIRAGTMPVANLTVGELRSVLAPASEAELEAMRARVDYLEARLATLEAPPVVPEGYEVSTGCSVRWNLWAPTADRPVVLDSPAALRALAWAIETGERPPHESDSDGK